MGEKNLPKRIKSFEKGVDKRKKRWYYIKAVSRRCRCGGSHLRTAPVSIPVRTLKIKQCMTSTKHTQYPLIPPRKREESGIAKTMPNKTPKSVVSNKLKRGLVQPKGFGNTILLRV